MSVKPFRFSVCSYGADTGAAWIAMARRAEELGYSALFVPDHFVGQVSAIPALAAAAAATTRLRVGTMVLSCAFRNPVLLAKEVATLDWLSDGRFELGLGAGWLQPEFDATGIPFEAPGVRIKRLKEVVKVIKNYFDPQPLMFTGEFYKAYDSGLDRRPLPVQKPHPPILIGAAGKRMLTYAAHSADAISLTFLSMPDGSGPAETISEATFMQKIETIRQAAGSRLDQIELNVVTWGVNVTPNIFGAAHIMSVQMSLPPEVLISLPYVLIGTIDQIVGKLQVARRRYGITHFTILDRDMEAFTPILHRLKGM